MVSDGRELQPRAVNPAINVPTKAHLYFTGEGSLLLQTRPQIGCAGKDPLPVADGDDASSRFQDSPNPPCFAGPAAIPLCRPGLYGKSQRPAASVQATTGKVPHAPMEFTTRYNDTVPRGSTFLDGGRWQRERRVSTSMAALFNMEYGGLDQQRKSTCPSNSMDGVTIIAFSLSGTNGGGFEIGSGSNVNLSAPTRSRSPVGALLGSTPCIPFGDPLLSRSGQCRY